MNAPFLTQAAEGLPRRGFTNRDVARMVEAGVIDEDEPFELIKGEIVPVSPELSRHFKARSRLARAFMRALSDDWMVGTEGSLFLDDDIELKPDLHIFRAHLESADVRGPDVALAVELSSMTQRRDLGVKAPIYARYGVKELWVIDIDAAEGVVFTRIENGAYAPGERVAENDLLRPIAFSEVTLTIADLLRR